MALPDPALVMLVGASAAGKSVWATEHYRPDEVVSSIFTADDKPALEARLGELAAGLVAGRFEPSPTPGADLCAGCPGRAALCSWPPERTFA